ncbi:MAG: VOC family protein, partial [Pseudomonadota bacterium]
MQRFFTNLLVEDPDQSATFYEQLLGMQRHFESSWFVVMTHPDMGNQEFGLFARDHAHAPGHIVNRIAVLDNKRQQQSTGTASGGRRRKGMITGKQAKLLIAHIGMSHDHE